MGFVVSPSAKSWIRVDPASDFPIQNLPFGVADLGQDIPTLMTRIGDFAVDVIGLYEEGFIDNAGLEEWDGLAEMGKQNIVDRCCVL